MPLSRSPNRPSHGVSRSAGLADQRGQAERARVHDAAAVERDRGAELAARRGEEHHPSAEAEPDDADARRVEALGLEVRDRRVDVGEDALVADAFEERHHLGEVVVRRGTAAGAVEHRRRDADVAGGGDAAGDVLDVVVHPERLLDHDDRALGLTLGVGLVDLHRPVGRGQHDRHVQAPCGLIVSAAICTALMIPW